MNITITMEEMENAMFDSGEGVCLACGDRAYGVEPDARKYECECCGERAVYGLEEAMVMGALDIIE